jgi:uncharacterized protein YjbJ (UPF0337 family)
MPPCYAHLFAIAPTIDVYAGWRTEPETEIRDNACPTGVDGHADENVIDLGAACADVVAGKRETLAGKIQEIYGVSKEETKKQLSSWGSRQPEMDQPK